MAWVKLMLRNLYFGGRQKSQNVREFFLRFSLQCKTKSLSQHLRPSPRRFIYTLCGFPCNYSKERQELSREKGQLHAYEELFINCPKCDNVVGSNNK